MNNQAQTLPIIQLPVFILPNGIMRLQIVKSQYLHMIKTSVADKGFIISLNLEGSNLALAKWGSWVEIINFYQEDYGTIEIDVRCKSLVNIHSINKGQENLYYGEASQLIHWSQSEKQTQDKSLSQSLESLFEQDSMLKDLYFDHPLKNTTWVVARWLELLPIKLEIKDSFVKNRNYREAKNFVQSIIFK